MYSTVLFAVIALGDVVFGIRCAKCDYMQPGSPLSGFRLCEDTCEGNLCFIVVSLYQNETLIAGCLDANDYDVGLFKNQSLCQRRADYTVCGCSKTNRCNSPMTSSKLFDFANKPILKGYTLLSEKNETIFGSETLEPAGHTQFTSTSSQQVETHNGIEHRLASDDKVRMAVSDVTIPRDDEVHDTENVQEANRERPVVVKSAYLSDKTLLSSNIANLLTEDQFDGDQQSSAETNDEGEFDGFHGPFTNGNQNSTTKIDNLQATKHGKTLAEYFNKSKQPTSMKSSSPLPIGKDYEDSGQSPFDDHEVDYKMIGVPDDNEINVNNQPPDDGE
ncbi:unnamed protein product [Toxocara canis]|uniref:Secreted protein n=1 Tax=Toxocara canis TaxID=6265 RepID=A0A183TVL7_TOXCA|nr:unnamed protein product [Toxocara canis]